MAKNDFITVEVVYAESSSQQVVSVQMPQGSTIKDAIIHSHLLDLFPNINLDQQQVGIFGKLKTLTDQPISGDRIEIYRSLVIDPMTARRIRANKSAL